MQIHELNSFEGTLGSTDYFATDNGRDTSKVAASDMFAPLNARIDNIIAGPAPSAQEVTDARLGVNGVTYPSLGDAIRTQITNAQNDVGSALDFTESMATGDGYKRLPFGEPTIDKVLKPDGSIVNGAGSGNNWAFAEFIPIPKGTIHFACADNYTYNFVFYDENKLVVDTIGTPSSMVRPFGTTYENSLACYMRAGCYRSGGVQGTETCFAYVYDEINAQNATDVIVPLYRNVVVYPPDLTTETASKTRMLSDFIYADEPLLIWSQNTSLVKFGVHLFDAEQNYIATYYVNDVKTYVSVPTGHYIKIYLANVSGNIYASKEIAECVKIQRRYDNIGYLSFASSSNRLSTVNTRVGYIDKEYTEKPLVIECEDYTNYAYNLAIYNDKYDDTPKFMEYARVQKNKSLIPGGSFYRYVVGPRTGTASLDDFAKIKVTEVNENTPEMAAVVASLGRTKYQADSDTFPQYYESHITAKAEAITSLAASSALQFAFVTDYHYGTYNQTHNARSLLTRLATETPLDIVVNGGDTWTSGTSTITYKEAKKRLLNAICETTPNAPCNWFFVLGNHDTGLDYNGQGQTFGPYFTTEEFQSIMGGNVTGYDVVYDPNSYDLAYYFDKDDMRVIVINNSLDSVGASEDINQVVRFFAKALLSMGDKTAVVISHEYFDPFSGNVYSGATKIANTIVAYNGRASSSESDAVDFSQCTGEVACWVVGHAHMDRDFTLEDGTKVIATTTCNAGGELGDLDRTVGTVNENAFDVFSIDTTNKTITVTRVGAGSDREFTY